MPRKIEPLNHEKYREVLRASGVVAIPAAAEAVTQFYGRLLATRGLNLVEAAIIRECGHRGPLTIAELAKELCTTRRVVEASVSPLVQKGLVTDHGSDRPPRRLAITDAGRQMLVEIVAGWDAAQAHLARSVGPRWQWLCDELAEIIAIAPTELDGARPRSADAEA